MLKVIPKPPPVSLSIDAELLEKIDAEMWTRRLRNRSEMIRLLVREGLHRAEVRRKKGQPVELGGKP